MTAPAPQPKTAPAEIPRFPTYLGRAFRLRCPRCGVGRLFKGFFTMEERCSGCGHKYDREPGYFLGSIYMNYGLTTAIAIAVYVIYGLVLGHDGPALQWGLIAFCILFSACFFRYARAWWMAFDLFWDPPQ